MRSFSRNGTPRKGPSGSAREAASARAFSKRGMMTAFSSGLVRSMRAIAASTSKTGLAVPRRTSSACAVASSQVRSSLMRGPYDIPRSAYKETLEIAGREPRVGVTPRALECGADPGGVRHLLLRPQALGEAEERAGVARVALQVGAEDRLRLGRPAGAQERPAERLAHRVVPVGRLVVVEPVLHLDRAPPGHDGTRPVAPRLRQARIEDRRGELEDVGAAAVTEHRVGGERAARRLERLALGARLAPLAGRCEGDAAREVPQTRRDGQDPVG